MLEILLLGIAVVAAYMVSHYCVITLEARSGRPLGAWRTVLFFFIFLSLILAAMKLLPIALAWPEGTAR